MANTKLKGSSMAFMMRLLMGFIICNALLKSINCTTTSPPSAVCTPQTDLEKSNKLTAINSAFPQEKTQLDLIIIIDRSKSIPNEVYTDTLSAIQYLFDYITKSGRLYIHKSYARVALLSFGKTITVEFEGISDDARTFDACEIDQRVSDLTAQATQEDSTQISAALSRASAIFNARNADANTKQILWVFYDGSIDENNEEDMAAVDTMSENGVTIFSAAIGKKPKGWMDTLEEENRVRALAKDNDHSACVETWIEILQQNTPSVQQGTETLYSELNHQSSFQPIDCGGCTPINIPVVCACDVINIQYGCYECNMVEGCVLENQTSRVTTSIPSSPSTSPNIDENNVNSGLALWLIVVIIVAGILVFLALITCILAIACCCSRRNKEKDGPEGPPLPLPPRKSHEKHLHIMQDDPTYMNSSTLKITTGDEGTERDKQEVEIFMGRNSFREESQRNMNGWDEFLKTEANAHQLKHLGVFNLDRKRDSAAWTPGFRLSQSQLRNIDKALSHGSVYSKKGTIRVHEKSYEVDRKTLSPLNLHAVRRTSRDVASGEQREDMHVSKVGNYLVVGVASPEKSDLCQQKVVEIRRHLDSSNTTGYDNINEAVEGDLNGDVNGM